MDDMNYIYFDDMYTYRPDLVAFHVYGVQTLFPLILSVNNVDSLIHFDKINVGDRIMLPQHNTVESVFKTTLGETYG